MQEGIEIHVKEACQPRGPRGVSGQTLGACAFLVHGRAWFKILSCGSLERKCPILITARDIKPEFKVWFDVDNCAFK